MEPAQRSVSTMSCEFGLSEWKHCRAELLVQRGVHGSKRRDVHGVCSGEVQDSDGLGHMHRLCRQHVLFGCGMDNTMSKLSTELSTRALSTDLFRELSL
jgi:hypothetical protein